MKRWNGHESLVWFILTYKNSNCCGHLLTLGEISPRMHLCRGKWITEILWRLLTSLQSFVAVKKKCVSEQEGLECKLRVSRWWGSRWWIFHVLWFYCTLLTVESSPADGEEPHQSPCPPTLSLGMMRSSEPCFKNTFPAQRRRDIALRITV